MTESFRVLQKAMARKKMRIAANLGIDPAEDGPEIPIIRFFYQYRDGVKLPERFERFTPVEALYLVSEGVEL